MEDNMRIIQSLDEMMETARGWLLGGPVGYVPTMGYLHAGHAALLQEARRTCEVSIASIVTNPLPFASPNDSRLVPYDRDSDLQLLSREQVDVVFMPAAAKLFPSNFQTYVYPSGPLMRRLEGSVRPEFFRGYATLMAKLFALVRPDIVYLGQKNAQLVALVQQLVRDLNIDVREGRNKLEIFLIQNIEVTEYFSVMSTHTSNLDSGDLKYVSLIVTKVFGIFILFYKIYF